MPQPRTAIRFRLQALLFIAAAAMLPACPTAPIGGNATITLNNQTFNTTINRIRTIAPDATAPGGNILNGAVAAGQSVELILTAPSADDTPEGARWTVILSGQLQVRAKQSNPDDLRTQLNNNFDTVDTSDNEELSPEEVNAAYPDITAFQFTVLDLDNDGFIERAEVGSLVRVAYGTFTCLREGDNVTWNFDGDTIGEYCGDAP